MVKEGVSLVNMYSKYLPKKEQVLTWEEIIWDLGKGICIEVVLKRQRQIEDWVVNAWRQKYVVCWDDTYFIISGPVHEICTHEKGIN